MEIKEEKVRPPTVAGKFYPSGREELDKMLDRFLETDKPVIIQDEIIGLVVPHAGYVFSGHVAGSVFREVQDSDYDVVIVISPTHVKAFRGASVFDGTAYRTPLGDAPVDTEFAKILAGFSDEISYGTDGHEWNSGRTEHSLEVEIPFIQKTLPGVPVVPVVMGSQNFATTDVLMRAIVNTTRESGKKILLVAGSDLSHFHDVETANNKDSLIVNAFNNYQYFKLSNQLFAGQWEACGGAPIVTVMMAAEQLGANKTITTKYATSADVPEGSGSKNRCVGYFAGALVKSSNPMDVLPRLSEEEKEVLLEAARSGVKKAVFNTDTMINYSVDDKNITKNYATFVTLHKQGKLRGCMGHLFTDMPLLEEISETSRLASTNDYRFGAVESSEINELEYEVTILSRMIRCLDTNDINIGRDGLYIRKGNNTGLLLPQVASERNWDKTTFLKHTCIKAGLPEDSYMDPDAMLYTFRAIVIN